jgi:hypothetical protein
MVGNDSKKLLENNNTFMCEICDYYTCKKSNIRKHLLTDKHKNNENDSKMVVNDSEKFPKVANFVCDCGKIYKYDSGYYRHKKHCNLDKQETIDLLDTNLVIHLLKQNDEFKNLLLEQNKQMMELCKNGISNNSHNTTNSHNKAFNLQFFLNETCKDAMNISEFVDSLTLQLSDLENVGKLGFVEGMSNIIIENMKLLDISKRPIHCMDTKREVMYLKDQDTWEKTSDDDNKKIRRAIKQIATKNVKNLRLFKEKHPDCINYNSKYSDQYLKLQTESCGGKHPDYENESKIIKRLAKVMAVDKSM